MSSYDALAASYDGLMADGVYRRRADYLEKLFSTTSLMSQWYFGFVGLNYMFGRTVAEKFKYIFPCFCIFGATLKSDMVWTIQDIALGLLTIPNLIAMIFLWPKVRKATKEFFGTPRT